MVDSSPHLMMTMIIFDGNLAPIQLDLWRFLGDDTADGVRNLVMTCRLLTLLHNAVT